MALQDLENYRHMQSQFERLGRAGVSQRAIDIIAEFHEKNDGSYKHVMRLAGRMKALCQCVSKDDYWREQTGRGYHQELHDITNAKTPDIKDQTNEL